MPIPMVVGLVAFVAMAVGADLFLRRRKRTLGRGDWAGWPLEQGLKPVGPAQLRVEKNTPVDIGMPQQLPSPHALEVMRQAAESCGADEVWWCWISISGGNPHLAFGVYPAGDEVRRTLAMRVEPVWLRERPENPVFDILALEDEVGSVIREKGARLYPRTPAPAALPGS